MWCLTDLCVDSLNEESRKALAKDPGFLGDVLHVQAPRSGVVGVATNWGLKPPLQLHLAPSWSLSQIKQAPTCFTCAACLWGHPNSCSQWKTRWVSTLNTRITINTTGATLPIGASALLDVNGMKLQVTRGYQSQFRSSLFPSRGWMSCRAVPPMFLRRSPC